MEDNKEEVKVEKKKPLTFKGLDVMNPTLYNSELEIYTKNKGCTIYTSYRNTGKIYYAVKGNDIKVCAVKHKE